MFYRDLKVDLRIDRGKIATQPAWLKLDGLRIFSSSRLDLDSNIRVYGAKNGETVELRSLLGGISPE